jgi:hypothetical protein
MHCRSQAGGLLGAVGIALCLLCGGAEARDAFGAIRCGQDISRALSGQKSNNEPVIQIEARHRDLNLKNLGGEEISDALNSDSWLICGTEYQLLYDGRQNIRDVLQFPAHARASPEFWGICERNGQKVSGTVVAVLENGQSASHGLVHYSSADAIVLPAKAAWRVDEPSGRFIQLSTNNLRCPRSGIITADGGP